MPTSAVDPDPAPPPAPRLLVLAALGQPWGTAAAAAAEAAGFEVDQPASARDLLRSLENPGAPSEGGALPGDEGIGEDPAREVESGDDEQRRSTPAGVLLVGRRLLAAGRTLRRRLVARTRELGLPLIVLAEAEDVPRLEELAAAGHLTMVEAPPSERVLAVVLDGLRQERERRLRVRRLQRRLEELRSAGQREERLLARVGHELRNPLGVLTTTLALLRDVQTEPLGRRYCDVIDRQLENLHRAVDHLLDMTGIEATPMAEDLESWLPEGQDDSGDDNGRGRPQAGSPGSGIGSAESGNGSSGERILLVEDNPDGRAALHDLLTMWGYDVEVAEAGEPGLALAAQRRPAVCLVDIDLPGINGYEVARRIRERYPESPPLLVAMTGFGQPEDRKRALAAGFDIHLVKPVRPGRLEEVLRRPENGSPQSL